MRTNAHKNATAATASKSKPFFSKQGNKSSQVEKPFFGPSTIQPKLAIGQPGDNYEQEADAMADQVMRMGEGPANDGETIQAKPLSVLQRKCTSCEEEAVQTKPAMMRPEGNVLGATAALSSKLNTSKGSGAPLTESTSNFMNTAFGADFSKVRVHTGENAIQMNQGLNARAFTHGSDVYFNQGQYNTTSKEGKKLLAHELTHTIQQGGVSNGRGKVNRQNYIQRQQETDEPTGISAIPGYRQNYEECGAASLITALIVWDELRRQQNPEAPSDQIALTCDIIVDHMANERDVVIERWRGRIARGRRQGNAESLYTNLVHDLTEIRRRALRPGSIISESQYNSLGLALYFLWDSEGILGLSGTQIRGIRQLLNINTSNSSYPMNFDALFSSSVVSGLQPRQIAQVIWFVVTNRRPGEGALARENISFGGHAFLIGRLGDGYWFLTDQGTSPDDTDQSETFEALSLERLRTDVRTAAENNEYWIWTGGVPSNVDHIDTPPEVTLLNEQSTQEINQRRQALSDRQRTMEEGRRSLEYIARMAHEGSDFRVQALLTLSRLLTEERIRPSDYRPVLNRAFLDDHLAVRIMAGDRIAHHRFTSMAEMLRLAINFLSGSDERTQRARHHMEGALARLQGPP